MTIGVTPSWRLQTFSPSDFRTRVDELLTVYVAAMRYPPYTESQRKPLWLEHSYRAGFACAVVLDERNNILGLCFGYTGASDQWWNNEVRRGLTRPAVGRWLSSYRELTELHVRPDVQGGGMGEAMLRTFLSIASEPVVLLSTPEGENRAWRLYRRIGFVDVLRSHHFAGDPRPFAILGRLLPIDQ